MLHERNIGDDRRRQVNCTLTVGGVLDRLPLRIAAQVRLERVFRKSRGIRRDRALKAGRVAIQAIERVRGKGIARFGQVRLWGVASCVGMMLTACATVMTGGVTVESPLEVKQKVVMERANARWQALMKGDAETSYSFFSSGSKAIGSLEFYKVRARLKGFRAVDMHSAACEAEICKVKLTVTLDHRLMKGIPLDVEESWVLENGQYWYVWRP